MTTQQPTLAPAPHPHASIQDSEQKLRAQLLPHIASSQTATPGTPGAAGAPAASTAAQPQQPQQPQQPTQQSSQQQHPQQQRSPPQRQNQKVAQAVPQQSISQAVAQQPTQHVQSVAPQPMNPQTPRVQNIQMAASPVVNQSVPVDQQQRGQSHSGPEESEQPKPRGGKRELSTSKRAAQNRAAQRAFRQRKEGYIKKLEEQVREFGAMQENFKQIQAENFALREYIITIQTRIIATQGADALPPAPVAVQSALAVEAPQLGAPVQAGVQPTQASQPPSVPIQQQPHPVAPTAVMQPQTVLQEVPGVPSTATPPQMNSLATTAGQKRSHDDTDNKFLQSIAQAAGTTGNGLVATAQPAAATGGQAASRKSTSPAAKRVKGEKVETKPEGEHVNGV